MNDNRSSATAASSSPTPRPGELRFAAAPAPRGGAVTADSARIVLVVKVNASAGFVLGMLATNEVEIAGVTDVVLPAEELGLPFPLCLQSDLVGAIWFTQLGSAVGRVSKETFRAIMQLRQGSLAPALRRHLGLPFSGRHDARWLLKQQEAAMLQTLSASCTSAIVDPPQRRNHDGEDSDPDEADVPPVGVLEEYGVVETLGTILTLGRSQAVQSLEWVTDQTDLPEGAVQTAVTRLVEYGFVIEDREAPGALRVNLDRACAIGISIQPNQVLGVLTNLGATELIPPRRRPLASTDVGAVVEAAGALADELQGARPEECAEVMGLGVELSGHIDARSGEVVFTPDLRSSRRYWQYVALADLLQERTGLSVVVENDANALALHEQWLGDGIGVDDFVVVLIGSRGVGSGLVVGGTLVRGSEGIAGELGHVVIDPGGQLCRCGNRGCLETIVSASAILKAIGAADVARHRDLEAAAAIVREGDKAAIAVFRNAGDVLGRGISMLLNLIGSSHVIVVGPPQLVDTEKGVESARLFMRAVDRSVGSYSFSFAAKRYKLISKRLREGMGAKGAASAMLERVITPSRRGQ